MEPIGTGAATRLNPARKVACHLCCLRELCAPVGVEDDGAELLQTLVRQQHVRLRRGEHLFRSGAPFDALFAVHTGSFKTYCRTHDGRERVEGFHFSGDLLGLDGIGADAHLSNAIALEDTGVCVLPYERLEELSRNLPWLQRQVHRMMSREIRRDQGIMVLLAQMSAEERVAAFLLNLAQRYSSRGFGAGEIHLSMSRQDIGGYIGLTSETVSRVLSRFQEQGYLAIRGKNLRIFKPEGLREILGLGEGVYFEQIP